MTTGMGQRYPLASTIRFRLLLLHAVYIRYDQHDHDAENDRDLALRGDAANDILTSLADGVGIAGQTEVMRERSADDHAEHRNSGIQMCIRDSSTNLLPDARRNRLRQRVIPLLREENPAVAQTVFRTCALLRKDDAYLDTRAREALRCV